MNEFALMALAAIVSSNIVAVSGVGAVSLQSEKRSFAYMLSSTMLTILPIIVVGLLCYLLNNFVLVPLEAEYMELFIVVMLTLIVSYFERWVLKKVSKEQFFLYEKSYEFAVQTVVCIATILLMEFKTDFYMLMFQLAMYCVGFFLVQIIFYALYEKLDNTYVLKPARNVPVMLYTLSVLSMILYAVNLFF